jgi:hypothetical protein
VVRRLRLEPGSISGGNSRASRANGGDASTITLPTVRTAAISGHVRVTFSRSGA